jgi:FemAB-related protein (PEP-CTERM system-associated)
MGIVVSKLDPQHATEWSEYVRRHPDGTFFHTLIWRDAVTEAFGHEGVYLTARRDGRLVGVFPLAVVSSRLAGTILVSVPYAVYGGTLADDAEVHAALLVRAQELARRLHANWVDIRSRTPQWPDLPVLQRYVTFRKELPATPADVLAQLPRKARAAARQARERHGLTVSFDDANLDTVWALYSKNMRRVASPNYPTGFFRTLVERTQAMPLATTGSEQTPSDGPGHVVQLVCHNGQPIAGLLSFVYRGTLMPYFAGCDERFENLHPNNFMYLTAMERAVELGCREFDFGRTRLDNEGPYNFKRFQGFEPTPLQYQYYVPEGGRTPDLHPGNPRLALARRVWPKLPLAVTRPLGAWLAKSIPG